MMEMEGYIKSHLPKKGLHHIWGLPAVQESGVYERAYTEAGIHFYSDIKSKNNNWLTHKQFLFRNPAAQMAAKKYKELITTLKGLPIEQPVVKFRIPPPNELALIYGFPQRAWLFIRIPGDEFFFG